MIIDFDLERYKKGNCEVFNKHGKKVEIIKCDMLGDFPIVGVARVHGTDVLNTYTIDGKYHKGEDSSGKDLVLSIKEPLPIIYVIAISYMDDEVRKRMVLPSFYSNKLKKVCIVTGQGYKCGKGRHGYSG